MRFRVRAPDGVSNISIPNDATISDLQKAITENTGLLLFNLKSGFPPQSLDLTQFASDLRISDTNLKLDGEQLIVVPNDIEDVLKHPLDRKHSASAAKQPPLFETASSQPDPSRKVPPATSNQDLDPPELPVPSRSGTLLMRVMPDDNSCLFRAVSSAVLGNDLDNMHDLRSMISRKITAQPDVYTQAVLEKSPERYRRWIASEDAWGGAIELGILSEEFDLEICTINVQDLQIYRFNQGRPKRCFLVYSGIHYDVLALSPSEPPHTQSDLPAELDIKIFNADDDEILEAARRLCNELRKRHYYTDTAGFGIRCNTCGWTGKGEKGATEHAKATGHYDFGEADA